MINKTGFEIAAGRSLTLPIFIEQINSTFTRDSQVRVAIVGGSSDEPELLILKEMIKELKVDLFGIDEKSTYLDLNQPISEKLISYFGVFDLILCNQVLEHVYDVNQAIDNLAKLSKVDGFIWITCPSSNLKHGSPDYFSAGYQSDLVSELFNKFYVSSIQKGEVGSKRLYLMTHKQRHWPSWKVLKNPFLRGSEVKSLLFPLRVIKNSLAGIEALTWNNKIEFNSEWSTETYFFGKKYFKSPKI